MCTRAAAICPTESAQSSRQVLQMLSLWPSRTYPLPEIGICWIVALHADLFLKLLLAQMAAEEAQGRDMTCCTSETTKVAGSRTRLRRRHLTLIQKCPEILSRASTEHLFEPRSVHSRSRQAELDSVELVLAEVPAPKPFATSLRLYDPTLRPIMNKMIFGRAAWVVPVPVVA